jgi:pimeloyl-ACP methyl ester carboxylesterase
LSAVFWSKAAKRRVQECYRGILDAWKTPHREHRFATSQGETFALTAGDPSRPPVVLLPGGMATSAMWLRTMDVLSADYHTVAVDIIGDAGFSAPSRPWMISDAHARWLDDVLEHFSFNAATFVGASLGGLLALDYAIRRCNRLGAMLRAAPLLYLGPWGHRKALDLDMGFAADDLRTGDNEFLRLFRLVQSGFVARMQMLPRFSDVALKSLTMPVLAVLGGRDALFDAAAARRRLAVCVPHAEILSLPGEGHGLHDMTPEIGSFLARRR